MNSLTTKCKTSLACKGYHHGDLRNALIIAADDLIREKGSLDFTMIDAARKAGVSSAAPYRHFKDKDALLQAVSEVAFLALDELTGAVVAAHPVGSTQSLIALGHSYIRFVTEHPQYYELLWGGQEKRKRDLQDSEHSKSGFNLFVDAVNAWCEKAGLHDYDPLELAVKMWANGHGLACLAMNENIEVVMPEADIYALFESSAHTFLDGLRNEVAAQGVTPAS
jgi:AcrR family transcriptional regulator